jgi:hypothetical protein
MNSTSDGDTEAYLYNMFKPQQLAKPGFWWAARWLELVVEPYSTLHRSLYARC